MGYYTDFELSFDTRKVSDFAVEEFLNETTGYDWSNFYLSGVKWYAHHEHMTLLSKKYPEVLFELSGEGEESGDLWKAYYLAGKCQDVKAKVVYDPFDESKLK